LPPKPCTGTGTISGCSAASSYGGRYDDGKLKKMPVGQAIAELIEEEGGPLIWPQITEAEQNSFDATCRKLYNYLNSTTKPAR